MKKCTSCRKEKDETEFGSLKSAFDGLSPCCKACRKEQGKKHRTARSNYDRKYREERREHTDKTAKAWREANKEEQKEYKSAWGKDNRDAVLKVEQAYLRTEIGRVGRTTSNHKRDKRVKGTSDGTVTTEALLNLKEEQNHKCYHCGEALDYETPRAIHLDHLVPLSKGGQHTLSNVKWSCAYCNLSKGSKL